AVIEMLIKQLEEPGGELRLETEIFEVQREEDAFLVQTSAGPIQAESVIVATGGLSIPKIGATGFAYELAKQFGHEVLDPRPALVPVTFTDGYKETFSELSGVAIPVEASAEAGPSFVENMLLTHRGLSGPSVLQVSSYWHGSEALTFDLLPGESALGWLQETKQAAPRQPLSQTLAEKLPARFAAYFPSEAKLDPTTRLASLSNQQIDHLAQLLKAWKLKPAGTEGWRTAEVTAGGVATDALSSRTMESKLQPGLFFIGECVDVTGWLGGYNFQWAWASAAAAAEVA
ncbi:MAG: aminoacetone oxidase family FAD-binding enzyme, partial [Pseudomonadota bacterium]